MKQSDRVITSPVGRDGNPASFSAKRKNGGISIPPYAAVRCRLIAMLLLAGVSVVRAEEAVYVPPPLPPEMTFPSATVVKITDLGAVADGKTLCNDAINRAIDQCVAAGGGIVVLPKTDGGSVYLAGAIHLKSNITLQVDEGVTLRFSTDRSLYPLVKSRFECTDVMNYSPLIYAYQAENIRITGRGTLDGQGQTWWDWRKIPGNNAMEVIKQFTRDREGKFPLEQRVFGDKVQGLRPCFIEPYECKNVLIEGVTLRESPFWNIHPTYCENVIIRNVTVFGTGPNTDGCDPDSCRNVLIEKSAFTTGDDCIVIKSGRDADGIRRNAPCENITIRDCTMNGGHGAVTMGSETSAGIRHVFAENCKVDGPDSAVRLKSTRGRGGGIEDVMVRNMSVTRALKYAITIDMKYTTAPEAPKSETTPVFKNVRIENFTCEDAPQAIYVMGLAESFVDGVSLRNINIKATKGATLEKVTGFLRDNVVITPKSGEAWEMKEVTEEKR